MIYSTKMYRTLVEINFISEVGTKILTSNENVFHNFPYRSLKSFVNFPFHSSMNHWTVPRFLQSRSKKKIVLHLPLLLKVLGARIDIGLGCNCYSVKQLIIATTKFYTKNLSRAIQKGREVQWQKDHNEAKEFSTLETFTFESKFVRQCSIFVKGSRRFIKLRA